MSCNKQPRLTTMKMSSSNKNFPQTGLIRGQNTETEPIIKKVSNKRSSFRNKND